MRFQVVSSKFVIEQKKTLRICMIPYFLKSHPHRDRPQNGSGCRDCTQNDPWWSPVSPQIGLRYDIN